jgi:ATPase subunit of ABC transporter with duplicated ATPase domains
MTHKPIQIENISLVLPHKSCFAEFSKSILYRERIGVIGRNGSGKTTLLKMLTKEIEPSSGKVLFPDDIRLGYVPQVQEGRCSLSGGQQFNYSLSQALAHEPNLLILDEPYIAKSRMVYTKSDREVS